MSSDDSANDPDLRFQKLATQLEESDARLRKLESQIDEIDDTVSQQRTTSTTPASPPLNPLYEAVEPWVQNYFVLMFIRPLDGQYRWCKEWWRHAEAISRLESLWRAWEIARLNPAGLAAWFRNDLDHQLPILLSGSGPFGQCTQDEHRDRAPLPTEQAPADWWTTVDE